MLQVIKSEEAIGGAAQGTGAGTTEQIDELDDIDFENEEEADSKIKTSKQNEPAYQIESTLLMGSRPHKEFLELFTQNLLQ